MWNMFVPLQGCGTTSNGEKTLVILWLSGGVNTNELKLKLYFLNYLRVKVHALCIGRMETTAHIWGPYILATGIGRLSASSKSLKESMKDYKPRKIERRDVDAGDGGKVLRYFLEYTDEVYISIPPGRKLNVLSENLTVKEMQD